MRGLRFFELVIRISTLAIMYYVEIENINSINFNDIVGLISVALILFIPYLVKSRSKEYLSKIYKEIKYAWPILNVVLLAFLIIPLYFNESSQEYIFLGGIGCLLIAIIQTLDLLFIKKFSTLVNNKKK